LGLYKLYTTIRTAGLTGKSSLGRIQCHFIATPPFRSILSISMPATFTTNFQVYSFVLSDGIIDSTGDSLSKFVNELNQINALQIGVVMDQWLNQYDIDATNAFYISNVKFVRLVPTTPALPTGVTNHSGVINVLKDLPQSAPLK